MRLVVIYEMAKYEVEVNTPPRALTIEIIKTSKSIFPTSHFEIILCHNILLVIIYMILLAWKRKLEKLSLDIYSNCRLMQMYSILLGSLRCDWNSEEIRHGFFSFLRNEMSKFDEPMRSKLDYFINNYLIPRYFTENTETSKWYSYRYLAKVITIPILYNCIFNTMNTFYAI